jgi:hypothetical protein
MANRTEYAPLIQDAEPIDAPDALADADAPPIYYGEGRFSPPSSASDDDYADQEKPLDPGAVERGSFDEDEVYGRNVMRDSEGLFLGRKVSRSNSKIVNSVFIMFVAAPVTTSLSDNISHSARPPGGASRRPCGTDIQPNFLPLSRTRKQTHYYGPCLQRYFLRAEAESGLG